MPRRIRNPRKKIMPCVIKSVKPSNIVTDVIRIATRVDEEGFRRGSRTMWRGRRTSVRNGKRRGMSNDRGKKKGM